MRTVIFIILKVTHGLNKVGTNMSYIKTKKFYEHGQL